MKRREFLKVVGSAAGGCAVGVPSMFAAEAQTQEAVAGLPRRPLGKTGAKVSVIGFPGLALMHYDQDRCTEALHSAFDRGLNYYDVAPEYGQKRDCETKMGIGLQGLDRSKYFLACKTAKRDKEGARLELESSLKLLKTDHFDLYQMHHLRQPAEVKQALGPGGALETFLKAKEEGKVKYFGFSAHTTKGALDAMKGFKFDTIMFPINFVEYYNIGFAKPVLELAQEQGLGVIAIKPLSLGAQATQKDKHGWWYRTPDTLKDTSLVLRFSLSQPGVAAGIPPSFLDLLDNAIEAAKNLRPLTAEETAELHTMAAASQSVFKGEEAKVALHRSVHGPMFADTSCESCACHTA